MVIAFLAVLLPAKADALAVRHYFTAFVGLFNASTAEFEYNLQPKNYSVRATVRTYGTFGFLYPFEADYFTGGRIDGDKTVTEKYHYTSRSRFNRRSKVMVYKNGVPVYAVSTKNEREKKKEITLPADGKDTTNLQSVLAAIARQYAELGFCDSRVAVFDGKKRFDVIFRDEGQENLKANEYSPFAGAAAKCSMYIDKLGAEGDDLLWQLSSDRPVYLWILKDRESDAPFIARVKIDDTPLGELNVYTTKIEVTK